MSGSIFEIIRRVLGGSKSQAQAQILSQIRPLIITDSVILTREIDNLKYSCNGVVGLDCEWTSVKNERNPVALLQLASSDGNCLLIRMRHLCLIPLSLKMFLSDQSILKVGVAIGEDAKHLMRDYELHVDGAVDLRDVVQLIGGEPRGLAFLSKQFLDEELDKNWRISASDWNALDLSETQIEYAAKDAYSGVKIYEKIADTLGHYKYISWIRNEKAYDWNAMRDFCKFNNIINRRHSPKNESLNNGLTAKTKKKKKSKLTMRQKPLYENCYMEASDGELLCTCSRQKADWYVKRELADVMNLDPYTIKLRFDPVARAVGEVGEFYKVPHENLCVVCGRADSYIKKNIIPNEYRRLFPSIMKDHSSHDVLLLCFDCHQTSNLKDQAMRLELEKKCDAPIYDKSKPKYFNDADIQKVQSAAKALGEHSKKHEIPKERRNTLEKTVMDYFKVDFLTTHILEDALKLTPSSVNPSFEAHSTLVVNYFMENHPEGLLALEEMWREYFLTSMKPSYMPEFWSVYHGRERLKIKFNEGRIDSACLKSCGLKTDSFDVSDRKADTVIKETYFESDLSPEPI